MSCDLSLTLLPYCFQNFFFSFKLEFIVGLQGKSSCFLMLLNFFSSFILIWVFMLCMQKLILAIGLLIDCTLYSGGNFKAFICLKGFLLDWIVRYELICKGIEIQLTIICSDLKNCLACIDAFFYMNVFDVHVSVHLSLLFCVLFKSKWALVCLFRDKFVYKT